MSESTKWMTLLALIVGAVFCYGIGFSNGFWTLIVLGGMLEISFWLGLLKIDD